MDSFSKYMNNLYSSISKKTVQFSCSIVSNSLQPHGPQDARPPCPSPIPGVYPTHVHWVGDAIQPSYPLLSSSPPAFNPSQHQGLSNESVLHIRWPKYWSFSFSISHSNEYSGLISFKINCFDLLAFQGTLKSFLQHHSLKASVLQQSAFFMVQLSHLLIQHHNLKAHQGPLSMEFSR